MKKRILLAIKRRKRFEKRVERLEKKIINLEKEIKKMRVEVRRCFKLNRIKGVSLKRG